jgi:hypothetical protein
MIRFIQLFDETCDCTLESTITHAHTHYCVHSHVFTSRCSVAASNGRRSPSFGFPNYPRASATASHINSSQRLNISSPLSNSLTRQPSVFFPFHFRNSHKEVQKVSRNTSTIVSTKILISAPINSDAERTGKGKGKDDICLIQHYDMKMFGGVYV